jgi:hypothetical protein
MQSLMQSRSILHWRLSTRSHMPSHHPTATQVNLPLFHFSVRTPTLPFPFVPFLSRHAHPLILSPSLAGLVGWDQSTVDKSMHNQRKEAWGWGRTSRLLHLMDFLMIVMMNRPRPSTATEQSPNRRTSLATATHADDDRHGTQRNEALHLFFFCPLLHCPFCGC